MKKCLFCQAVMLEIENGNRHYCDDDCYYSAKLQRQKEKRNHEAKLRSKNSTAELILKCLCLQHGAFNPFNPLEAEEMGFYFGVADSLVNHEGKQGILIGEYAYQLLNPKQMIVWTA